MPFASVAAEHSGFSMSTWKGRLLFLDFIQAERESNWLVHLETCKAMLPYDKSFEHYRYLSWGLIYLIDMLRLPKISKLLSTLYMDRKHTVSRSKSKSWLNTVSTEMASEQSLNKDCKTKGKGAHK